EGFYRFFRRHGMKHLFPRVGTEVIQCYEIELYFELRMDELDRFAILQCECGPECLMALYDFVETGLQGCVIELATKAETIRQVVGWVARVHLIDEPYLTLGKGQRCGVTRGTLDDQVRSAAVSSSLKPLLKQGFFDR